MDRGWIPHDDGLLGQTALRALTGELPHRDFADPYTGALDYWNALSFVLFGINLLAPRLLLYASFLAFLGAAHGIARRFVSELAAAAAMMTITVWSLPNYPAAMPTWYNLFLAVAALWCFIRFVEERRRRWLLAAGVACGLSLLMKSVGLYAVAALLMALALHEIDRAAGTPSPVGDGRAPDTAYRVAIVGGMVVFVTLVALLVRARLATVEITHFVLPSTLAAALVGWRCATVPSGATSAARFAHLLRMFVPFLAGVLAPVVLFVIPWAASGSLASLVQEVLILPFRRFSFAAASPLPLALFLPGLPVLALAVLAGSLRGRARTAILAVLGATLTVVWFVGARVGVYQGVWGTALLSPAVAVLAGALALAHRGRGGSGEGSMALGGSVVAMLATFTLVQYPFSGPVYYFYVAPLAVMAGAVAVGSANRAWRAPALMLLVFAVAFGLRWVSTASLLATAQGRYEVRADTERLTLPRGKIRVSAADKAQYEDLVSALHQRAVNGVVYATPDTPETYFLSGLRNPTRTLYEFLDDPQGHTAAVLSALDAADVGVVVLNRAPQFSGPPAPELLRALESTYPGSRTIGHFVIRWK